MQSARRISTWAGGSEPAPDYWGLCLTAEEAGSTVALTKTNSPPAVTLETSRDGLVWTPYTIGDTITLANVGDRIFFASGDGGNTRLSTGGGNRHTFTFSGRIAASGNTMSLLNRNEALTEISGTYALAYLFDNCTSLVAAPELPATTLASSCYQDMFNGCTSLVAAPELPATTLASSCYRHMFDGCTSLVAAPELPATTLTSGCYREMFYNCTSLVAAPELPATTLTSSCYNSMFFGCTSLTNIKAHFTAWGLQTNYWVNGVAASGVFECPDALPHTASDFTISKIPPGWTVETF